MGKYGAKNYMKIEGVSDKDIETIMSSVVKIDSHEQFFFDELGVELQ